MCIKKDAAKIRRGDLVIVKSRKGYHPSGMTGSEREYRLGKVTSVSRDGSEIRAIQFADRDNPTQFAWLDRRLVESVQVITKDGLDVDSVLFDAGNHRTSKMFPEMVFPYDNAYDVQQAIDVHKL
jgi:hypothetical protein